MATTKSRCESKRVSEIVNGEIFQPPLPETGRRRVYKLEEKRRLVEETRIEQR